LFEDDDCFAQRGSPFAKPGTTEPRGAAESSEGCVYFFARGHANATEVPLTREEAEALVRGDRVRLGHRTGRISEVFPTLVYVQWDAGKQNEAYTLATLLRFELDRRKAK
jgi:hypothetical protein